MRIKTRELLKMLGFEEDWSRSIGVPPSYKYDFGNFVLSATQVMNRHFQEVIQFDGIISTPRMIQEMEFQLLLEVESFEQGVAIIAEQIGYDFVPQRPTRWLQDGAAWKDHLPWVRQLREYETRPLCTVKRDWFRLALKDLIKFGEHAPENEVVDFHFCGAMLQIATTKLIAVLPAHGAPWTQHYRIRAKSLRSLSQRLTSPHVEIGVWKGRLQIGRREVMLVKPDDAYTCTFGEGDRYDCRTVKKQEW